MLDSPATPVDLLPLVLLAQHVERIVSPSTFTSLACRDLSLGLGFGMSSVMRRNLNVTSAYQPAENAMATDTIRTSRLLRKTTDRKP